MLDKIQNEIVMKLMRWFDANRREMPWRGELDPYKIWVSEVMLQQTQVVTVDPYYRRFMENFPDISALASADLDQVLRLWQGLGYYSRARNLLKGAQFVCDNHQGKFPSTYEAALKIPGVGEYIAGAVLSIAYNKPEPAVDGNVIRSLTRIFGFSADTTKSSFKKKLRNILKKSYYDQSPCWVNQAWMEFGALQCSPKPDCSMCPLAELCYACRKGQVQSFPVKKSRKKIPLRKGVCYCIEKGSAILLVQRPLTGLLPGLWEMPNCMLDEITRREFEMQHGIVSEKELLGTVQHTYSHFKVQYSIFKADLQSSWKSNFWVDCQWLDTDQADHVARPAVQIKAFKLLRL